jgi:predicted transcriptional regulator
MQIDPAFLLACFNLILDRDIFLTVNILLQHLTLKSSIKLHFNGRQSIHSAFMINSHMPIREAKSDKNLNPLLTFLYPPHKIHKKQRHTSADTLKVI